MEIKDQCHNGYHAGIILDDNLLVGSRVSFDLRQICSAKVRFWSTQETGIPTKAIQLAYKFRLKDATPAQAQQMSRYFGNERLLWKRLVAEQKTFRPASQKPLGPST